VPSSASLIYSKSEKESGSGEFNKYFKKGFSILNLLTNQKLNNSIFNLNHRARINPIDEIAARFSEGPLDLLSRCYKQRSAVRVVTRHDQGMRGIATGTLVAFDKHMNLVLRDVEESYTVLLSVERPTQHGGMRRCRKQEKRHRKLKQVFLAGNSVALVSGIT